MRATLSALVVATGLLGFGSAVQAAPAAPIAGLGTESPFTQVQLTMRERMIMRDRMERRMMRRQMERRMMRRDMERRMMRRDMRRDMYRRY
jgi:hypothetical protein